MKDRISKKVALFIVGAIVVLVVLGMFCGSDETEDERDLRREKVYEEASLISPRVDLSSRGKLYSDLVFDLIEENKLMGREIDSFVIRLRDANEVVGSVLEKRIDRLVKKREAVKDETELVIAAMDAFVGSRGYGVVLEGDVL